MLFALVLLFTDPAGQVQAYELDTGLTMEDCAPLTNASVRHVAIGGAEFDFPAGSARIVCEVR